MKLHVLTFGLAVFWAGSAYSISTDILEPSYSYMCEERDLGQWSSTPGDAPDQCLAKNYGNEYRARYVYKDYILNKTGAFNYSYNKQRKFRIRVNKTGRKEISRYATNMKNIVSVFSENFITNAAKEEGRELSDDEKEMFSRCVVATTAIETNFSHFRYEDVKRPSLIKRGITEPRLFFQVGDRTYNTDGDATNFYKARGIMQFHPLAHGIEQHKVFDLSQNLYHGLNNFYRNWREASEYGELKLYGIIRPKRAGKPAATILTNLRNRKRACSESYVDKKLGGFWENVCKASYSAHNGGRGRMCRWADSPGRYKRFQAQFKAENNGEECTWDRINFGTNQKLKDNCDEARKTNHFFKDLKFTAHLNEEVKFSDWRRYLDKTLLSPIPVDYNCLVEGYDLCAIPREQHDEYLKGTIVRLDHEGVFDDRNFCVLSDEDDRFHCTNNENALVCLNKYQEIKSFHGVYKLRTKPHEHRPVVHTNRHELCEGAFEGFAGVGQYIRTEKNISLRKQPLVRNPDAPGQNIDNKFWYKQDGRLQSISTEAEGVYQVLGFEFNTDPHFCGSYKQCRFYKIRVAHPGSGGYVEGYVFGGSEGGNKPWQKWATPVSTSERAQSPDQWVIPQAGDKVAVQSVNGLPFLVDDYGGQIEKLKEIHQVNSSFEQRLSEFESKLQGAETAYNECKELSYMERWRSKTCLRDIKQMESDLVSLKGERPLANELVSISLKAKAEGPSFEGVVTNLPQAGVLDRGTNLVVRRTLIQGEAEELYLEVEAHMDIDGTLLGPVIGFIPAGRLTRTGKQDISENVLEFISILEAGKTQ